MWHDDHAPPHVHAEYQGFVAQINIGTGEIIGGTVAQKSCGDRQGMVPEAPGRTV